jgi:hypothetical protein
MASALYDNSVSLRRAEVLLDQRCLVEAIEAFNAAERLGADPDPCCGGRWRAFMLLGDFASAWHESDALRARNTADPHRFWNGENLSGKRVMLRCLHGFGDAVQMLRYLPRLRRLASHLIVEVPPRLLPLAPFFRGVAQVITWGDSVPAERPVWDVQLEIMELPYVFRTVCADLPLATNYLELPQSILTTTAQTMDAIPRPETQPALRIGVVWKCGEWDPQRSVPLDLLRPLLELPGVQAWSLQGDSHASGVECYPSLPVIMKSQTTTTGDGLIPLAATISHLDLILTVDTLAAHLAGALGRPVWLMLQHAADWRWMNERDDSPWYPTMRIFRQPKAGDWASIMRDVETALTVVASERAS